VDVLRAIRLLLSVSICTAVADERLTIPTPAAMMLHVFHTRVRTGGTFWPLRLPPNAAIESHCMLKQDIIPKYVSTEIPNTSLEVELYQNFSCVDLSLFFCLLAAQRDVRPKKRICGFVCDDNCRDVGMCYVLKWRDLTYLLTYSTVQSPS